MEILGTDSDKAAAAAQLQGLYEEVPDAVVAGSFGRAAIYASHDYPDAPPLDLRDPAGLGGYRDIDVLFTSADEACLRLVVASAPVQHAIHDGIGLYVWQALEGPLLIGTDRDNKVFTTWISNETIVPVDRTLLGAPVRTFSVGTQLHIENIVGGGQRRTEKLVRSSEVLTRFAATLDPDSTEFLQDAVYEPFREHARRNVR